MKLTCPHCGAPEVEASIIEKPGSPLCGACRRQIPGGRPLFVVETYLRRQQLWSLRTFGEGQRTKGIVKHIEKELVEIRQQPHDLIEWIDVVILALDGYWRHGGQPEAIMDYLQAKQNVNFARAWQAPRDGEPTEHDRTAEGLRPWLADDPTQPHVIDSFGYCMWCRSGNPRVRSSVSEAFVHTDTPVGRVVCKCP